MSTAEVAVAPVERASVPRIAGLLSKGIFASLLVLIVLSAIPYGSAEPWWKALFTSLLFLIAIAWIVEGWLVGSWRTGGRAVLMPLVALAVFAFVQTISFRSSSRGGVSGSFWNAISADPYSTRFFAVQVIALTIAGGLFYRYAKTEKRTNTLIHLILGVAVASALFGILRQTTQHQLGFGLPLIRVEQGYGQFINKNHFAFLMEMAFGLALGLMLVGGIRRERALIYFAALFPVWTALVLSNSKGGILAMLAQLVVAALLFSPTSGKTDTRLLRIARSLPVRISLAAVLVIGMFVGTIWMGGDRLASNIEGASAEFDPAVVALRLGANRQEIWQTTLQMFRSHPIAGIGMGGYWTAITAYHDASGTMTPQEAHNDYLELIASGGLIGIALGVWFVFVVFKRIRRNLNSPDRFRRTVTFAATVGIAGVSFHSLVDFGLHMFVNALIFIALIAIATNEREPVGEVV